jgi:hypothetical protein
VSAVWVCDGQVSAWVGSCEGVSCGSCGGVYTCGTGPPGGVHSAEWDYPRREDLISVCIPVPVYVEG